MKVFTDQWRVVQLINNSSPKLALTISCTNSEFSCLNAVNLANNSYILAILLAKLIEVHERMGLPCHLVFYVCHSLNSVFYFNYSLQKFQLL